MPGTEQNNCKWRALSDSEDSEEPSVLLYHRLTLAYTLHFESSGRKVTDYSLILPGTHPSDGKSWSGSRCGSAHNKLLWTRRPVWLFLHKDKPLVWRREWICTAPEDIYYNTHIITYSAHSYFNIRKIRNTASYKTNKWCTHCEWVKTDERWRDGWRDDSWLGVLHLWVSPYWQLCF